MRTIEGGLQELAGLDPDKIFEEAELRQEFALLVQQAPDPESKINLIRLFLELSVMTNPDSLDDFSNIKIVEKKENRFQLDDCFTYLFGHKSGAQEITDMITSDCKLFTEPLPGAYAVYLDSDLNPTHIGKVTSERNVISKWGLQGHVYEHPPILVPFSYGPYTAYYSNMESK